MENSMPRRILWGTAATIATIALVALAGHGRLPRTSIPRYSCLCPDSARIVSPRSLSAH